MTAAAATPRTDELAADLMPDLERVRRALEGRPPPQRRRGGSRVLDRLTALFGLSEFERSVLALCAGVEIEPEIAAACAETAGAPSFGLALSILPESHWSAMAPSGPLRRWRLVRLERTDGSPVTTPIRIEERVLHLLAGIDAPEPELDGLLVEAPTPAELPPSRRRVADRLAAVLAEERAEGRWPRVLLCGGADASRRDVVASAAARAGLRLLAVEAGALPRDHRDGAGFARLCAREAALSGAVLLLETGGRGGEDGGTRAARRFAAAFQGALVVAAEEPRFALEGSFRIEIPPPQPAERKELWRSVLADSTNGALDAVAGQFDLDPAAIRAAAREALATPGGSLPDRVWDACRARARPVLDDLAQRIDSSVGWDDLVLPRERIATLREVATQVRWRFRVYDEWGFASRSSRGLGISALFAGPSGTGKTLAAEVLANELRLDLYRIDLSSVVSKYIGETEKNLRRVFEAAECGAAVLLFDEADALFGKRTDVKDSHDRFANIEISYLLQRMESYRGLAILTTNQRRALDEAFLRRLRFVVEFPFPEARERSEIWSRVVPQGVPTDGLQPERLAQLAIAGGNIRNVALGAAFLAADSGSAMGMEHVLRSARTEYAKLERPISGPELEGWR
jgi:ATPase family associated with various cellular activities (AAA)/Winged helix domain, variant